MTDPTRSSRDAVTTPVGVTTLCPQCGASVPAFETRCSACGALVTQASDDEQRDNLRRRLQAGIGDTFELLDLLGKGGMGVVFRAREKALEREVALKVLAFDPLMVPEAFARFEREAKLAARLDHPHIVPIFAVGQGQGVAYYTMRLVRGGSLEDLLAAKKRIEPPRALRILKEIAAALDHAHSQGVVHRDVKPANVMLGDNDHVMVADFGIARAVGGGSGPALTSTGVVGSPAYMAPEQWQGQPVDGRADQYALGILAYELLTGKRPYRDATMHELLRLHLTEDLPDISQELPTATPAMRDALRRATAKEPKDRFETTSAFVKALDVPSGTPVAPMRAVPAGASARAAAGAAPAQSAASRWLPVGLVIALVGGGGFFWWNSRSAPPAAAPAPALPESVVHEVIHDTVVKPAKPDTVRLQDTIRVPTPLPANGRRAAAGGATLAGGAATPAATAPGSGAAPAASQGYIFVAHPLLPRGVVRIDTTTTIVGPQPALIPVPPGSHFVSFRGPVATLPAQYPLAVRAGDTVRVMFVPAEGGGGRGDSLRAAAAERLRRAQQAIRGRGGRRGGGR